MTWHRLSQLILGSQIVLLISLLITTLHVAFLLSLFSTVLIVGRDLRYSFVRLVVASHVSFFAIGYYLFERMGYQYSTELLYLNCISILIMSAFFLFYIRLGKPINIVQPSYMSGLNGFVVSVAGILVLLYFPFLQTDTSRISYQSGNGALNLLSQAVGALCIISSYHLVFRRKLLSLILACLLFVAFSLSRSSAMIPLVFFTFFNYPYLIPKAVVVGAGTGLFGVFTYIAAARALGSSFTASFFHAVSDPIASHRYFSQFQNSAHLHGEYIISYFSRLVPRSIWPEKPEVIGFGREVILNEQTRTPGLVVEGFANFDYLGSLVFPILAGFAFLFFFEKFWRAKRLTVKVFSALFCFDFLTFGRTIAAKIPYVLVENLIITIMALAVVGVWAVLRRYFFTTSKFKLSWI